jgi:integrase/recombinase XerD
VRGYQNGLRLFCSYIADPDYGWDRVCEQRFGTHPAQVFFAWNTATHVQDNEQDPEKRPFTKQELQHFFDHADDQVTLIANSRKKGWLPAYRDSVMFKVAYSYGCASTNCATCRQSISRAIPRLANSATMERS